MKHGIDDLIYKAKRETHAENKCMNIRGKGGEVGGIG